MDTIPSKRILCLSCSAVLSSDDTDHYGYQCHACVVHEHELVLTWRRDPDHPDCCDLADGPVDLGLVSGKAQGQLNSAMRSGVASRPIAA